MVTYMKLAIFLLSNLGMWEILRRNTKIDKCFFPGCIAALETVFLLAAGLLNVLREVSLLLWLIGLIYFVHITYKDRGIAFLKEYIDYEYVFLGVIMAAMLFSLHGKMFTHYDNFSHWALVVRRMLDTNRFPNFMDDIIVFRQYPLGSAVYIYFVGKFVSQSESIQMLAQVYLMTSSIMPLFYFAKRNKIAVMMSILVMTNLFFVMNITVTNLLVDTLLPLVALSGLTFIFFYFKKDSEKTEIVISAAYLIQMVQIKNSGVFFAAAGAVLILYRMWKERFFTTGIITCAMPLLAVFFWHKHCIYVFRNAGYTKHAMTMGNYKAVFREKSAEDIYQITVSMFKYALINERVIFCMGMFLLFTIAAAFFLKKTKPIAIRLFLVSIAAYLLYQLGNLAMYLFSMPLMEAYHLASVGRYTSTILIGIMYVMMIVVISMISEIVKGKAGPIALTLVLLAFSMGWMFEQFHEIRNMFQYKDDPTKRIWLEKQKADYQIPEGESYAILIPENDSGYFYYLGKYVFQTSQINSYTVENLEDIMNISEKYLILYDSENAVIENWIEDYFPEQIGNEVIIRE